MVPVVIFVPAFSDGSSGPFCINTQADVPILRQAINLGECMLCVIIELTSSVPDCEVTCVAGLRSFWMWGNIGCGNLVECHSYVTEAIQ
jgi:hypothetical protein